jgi:glycosyltransferase involved in cell wall biosynthesis
MRLEVLMSCMNQKNFDLIYTSQLNSDILLINQCNVDSTEEIEFGDGYKARMINSSDRGLSKSRNTALANANGDICLLADDDETFYAEYSSIILNEFEENPRFDIIAFIVDRPDKSYSLKKKRINYISSLKIGSCQIAFKRRAILNKGIKFNEKFGSGTDNGPGEENLFLYECLKKGLKILYVPVKIGKVSQSQSEWFKGFDKMYFFNRGKILKELMGGFFGLIYALEFAIMKYPRYYKETSFPNALALMIKGIMYKEE